MRGEELRQVSDKYCSLSSSLFAHGLGGFEVLLTGEFGIVSFIRDLSGSQSEWSEDFRLETYSVKLSLLIL
jgi:hypothetical protein